MSRATTVQEIKWGSRMTDCDIFLNHLLDTSETASAISMEHTIVESMNNAFRNRVLNVIRKKDWDPKKNSKFLSPTNSLPKIPFAGLYFWKATTRPQRGA